ncbi:NAD(P)H-hydrate dehydratase [Alicyclobacillus sp. SO9]|uniref:NAD(P)H-hydrate dehydratase n=1 Tax=Alicyclobacillus sp. SO9 TaxID=2665646 RepID=UPI0018E89AC6|nr:NAD(P)H-hydrate dehydratase [Alicyclobacillus sp. SO9]QQE78620.1 NAD(P)H-hydrate dehydratase [Alicyclobacillus sp. SO9]
MILVTSKEMRQFDEQTITSGCVPGIVLMEHAGKAVADTVRKSDPTHVCVLCGKGNNGGDGWIAARLLHRLGVSVQVISAASTNDLSGDARTAYEMAHAAGVTFAEVTSAAQIPEADMYVDALLGTGTTRPLEGLLQDMVQSLNERAGKVVAVDVPTGVNASTGEVPGLAVEADETVCIAAQKLGTAVAPGCYFSGTVHVVDIGIDIPTASGLAEYVDLHWVRQAVGGRWPLRKRDSHKGTFGKTGIAVGEMKGAPILAGLGAARSGSGLIVMASSEEPMQAPLEFVLRRGPDTDAFSDCQSIVVGPGLGQKAAQWMRVLKNWDKPAVIDADGLVPAVHGELIGRNCVLTPHPKECARLLGWTTQEVQSHRAQAAVTLAEKTGAVVVLKGYHTLIASPDAPLLVNSSGNEALATAGTGDVLAGVIGGLLAQGLHPREAAAVGAWLHGCAGELAGSQFSSTSVMASDVVESISRAICLHFDSLNQVRQQD